MATHKIQVQNIYGSPTPRSYLRLRLPRAMTEDFVAEHGENLFIRVISPDTLQIGGPASGGTPVRILDVKERRGITIRHFRQVMLPVKLSGGVGRGEPVNITREGDIIQLKFGRALFGVETQAAVS